MYKNKTIIVTGGTGFLGKAIVAHLQEQQAQVISVSRNNVDLCHREKTIAFFAKQKPDIIIHCAVQGGGIGWMKEHPVESGQDNIRLNTNALEASFLAGARSFIGVSSGCVYPKHAKQPYLETEIWGGYPEPLNGTYALSKRMMMDLGRAYAKQHQFHCVFPVLANLYGIGDHLSSERAHVVADLMLRCADNPKELVVWGTGIAEREFLYIDDAVEGVLACLQGESGSFFNIGSGDSTSIVELARLIRDSFGLDIPIRFDSTKPDGQLKKVLSVAKAKQELHWTAKISLKEGIQRTVDWYREAKQ